MVFDQLSFFLSRDYGTTYEDEFCKSLLEMPTILRLEKPLSYGFVEFCNRIRLNYIL